MSEVVLVQPIVGHWDTSKKRPWLPLGLLKTASLVSKDFKTVLIDQRLEKDWKKKLGKELNKNPLLIGVTSITGQQLRHALEISKFVKSKSPNTPVVWGGPHASILPEQTVKNDNVDIVVKGDGEKPLLEIAKRLEKNKSLKGIPSVTYQTKRGIIKSNKDQKLCNINSYPRPAYELINFKDYIQEWRGRKVLPLETSKGCPHECTFCYSKLINKQKWRPLTADKVLERIKFLMQEAGVSGFHMVDDNLFVNKKRVISFAQELIKEGLDIEWHSQGIRIDSFTKMNPNDLRVLEKAGLREGNFGVESGSPKTLKKIKKGITLNQVLKVNKKLVNYNIRPEYNFIIGFPHETITDFKKTIDFALRLLKENPDSIINHIACFTPYPGAEIFKECVKLGFNPPEALEEWVDFGWHNVNLTWLNKEEKHFIKSTYFLSHFMDERISGSDQFPYWLRILAKLYQPISKFRLSNKFYHLMIEQELKKILLRDSEW